MQHHLHHHHIEHRIGQRQPIHVALPHRTMPQPRLGQPRARQRQHGPAGIHPQRRRHTRRHPLQQRARAGPDIEQMADIARQRLQQRTLHRLRRQIQRPHLIPIRPGPLERLRRHPRPLRQHPRRLPPVGREHRILLRNPRQQQPRQGPARRRHRRQREPGIGPLPRPIEQPRLAQQPQMPGQPRLRLRQDFGKLRHAKLPPGRQRQKSQPRRLRSRAQSDQNMFHGLPSHKDILMSR